MTKNKYQSGNIVIGCVTGIEKYGIFVGLDDYYSGLIHISEVSDSFVKNLNDYVNLGETIRVKIIDSAVNDFHVKLSIKNIDYRLNKRKKVKIIETAKGFTSLKENMEIWIKNKLENVNSIKTKKI